MRIFLVTGAQFMTRLLPSNLSCVTGELVHESGMACTVAVAYLVKPRGVVLEFFDAGQRRQYRGLVLAIPLASRTASRRLR